jgi:hypothetical protein
MIAKEDRMNSLQKLKTNDQSEQSNNGGFRICGRVKKPLVFSIEKLQAMETVEQDDLLLTCGSGEPKGRINQCRGVLLADIIHRSNVLITDHNDTKKMFIIASSDDGYKTVFSWQEVFNTSVGDGIMVLLEKDGKPLYEGTGPVDLFSAKDYLTGPRYVKELADVEIVMVE